MFTPPSGWQMANVDLPKHVRVMIVGPSSSGFPPSMNLSSEPYNGTLRQYLKTVKNLNEGQGYEWKDLGTIRTEAGNASLSQVDTKTSWGIVRLMHVILLKNGTIYILTASALKDEFSKYYNPFFLSMRSLKAVDDVYQMVGDIQQRNQLKVIAEKLQIQWNDLLNHQQLQNTSMELKEKVFMENEFQNKYWKPFQETLNRKFGQYGSDWQTLFLQKLRNRLVTQKPS